ncbi:MAG TPA: LysM peptidoglycan-binding domain-containing protein [Rhizobiaceae bacterium]|nr:LysM peptidoglycan-binding domain-containing protein [Rhizobiaceae bacterium]
MNANTTRLFFFLLGGIIILAGGGYIAGVFDRFLPQDSVAVVQVPATVPASPAPAAPASGGTPAAPQDGAPPAGATPPANAPAQAEGQQPAEAAEKKGIPTFDLVRLEPDGSLIVAGQALPEAKVEVVSGASVLGENAATPGGDFAVVLDDPLAPGDYTLVLRATNPDGTVLTSLQSAIVSVPERENGEVLVMVEQPGEASKILTVPQPAQATPAPAQQDAAAAPAPAENASPQPPAGGQPAVAEAAPAKPAGETASAAQPEENTAAPAKPPVRPTVTIEAVEIEGPMVFVAGSAEAGRQIRAYANEIMLGQTAVSEGGRFLVEARRDLPVGEYVIRVDVLGPDGTTVIARAAVPFQREPGEQIAAVAPPAGQAQAAAPGAPANGGNAPADGQAAAPGRPAASAVPANPPAGGASGATAPAGEAAAPSTPPTGRPATGGNDVAAAPETTAPKLQSAAGSVIIRRGDTLWRISRRVYGMGVRYSTIYLANQDQIADPDRIWPGQVFSVPRETDSGEPADMSTIADQVKKD